MRQTLPGFKQRLGRPLRDCSTQTPPVTLYWSQVNSTSGLFTALALPPTVGSDAGTVGLILPHGTADLSFDGTVGSDPQTGCLCLVIGRAWSPSCRLWQGVSNYLFCTALHCRAGPKTISGLLLAVLALPRYQMSNPSRSPAISQARLHVYW